MSRSPTVHCHFMLHFYERINDDDDDDDDDDLRHHTYNTLALPFQCVMYSW